MSLDLRGVLPTTAELDQVEADPAALDTLRDTWLADPRLEARVMEMLGHTWHTRVDEFLIHYFEFPELAVDPTQEYAFQRAFGEEPLRLAARIGVQDRPWTDIVTADFTMATPLSARLLPIDYPEGETGWQEARYTDGRPPVGILATSGLWWRYYSTARNLNRGRAAAAMRLLICEDLLARPVTTSSDGLGGSTTSVKNEPTCMGCHSAVDPAAAALFGFYMDNPYHGGENGAYHAEREQLGPALLEVEPAWFGQPVDGLEGLAWAIADDPRFVRCAARTFTESLWHRPVEDTDRQDAGRLQAHRDAFVEGELRLRPLLVSILDGDAYRAGVDSGDRERTLRWLGPALMASVVEDLSGFRWIQDGAVLMDSDVAGFRIMTGGVDGLLVGQRAETSSLTASLVARRLAEGAAAAWVAEGGAPVVQDAEDADLAEGIAALHWRLVARRPDAAEVEALVQLWADVAQVADHDAAWAAVMTVLLRDPEFLGY
jgi:hypothetical protein